MMQALLRPVLVYIQQHAFTDYSSFTIQSSMVRFSLL